MSRTFFYYSCSECLLQQHIHKNWNNTKKISQKKKYNWSDTPKVANVCMFPEYSHIKTKTKQTKNQQQQNLGFSGLRRWRWGALCLVLRLWCSWLCSSSRSTQVNWYHGESQGHGLGAQSSQTPMEPSRATWSSLLRGSAFPGAQVSTLMATAGFFLLLSLPEDLAILSRIRGRPSSSASHFHFKPHTTHPPGFSPICQIAFNRLIILEF